MLHHSLLTLLPIRISFLLHPTQTVNFTRGQSPKHTDRITAPHTLQKPTISNHNHGPTTHCLPQRIRASNSAAQVSLPNVRPHRQRLQ